MPIIRHYRSQSVLADGHLGAGFWQLERYQTKVFSNYNPGSSTPLTIPRCGNGFWWGYNALYYKVGRCQSTIEHGLDVVVADVQRWDGRRVRFQRVNNEWVAPPDHKGSLVVQLDAQNNIAGWKYSDNEDSSFSFDASGRLVSLELRSGVAETLEYDRASGAGGDDDSDTLDRITDNFGRYLEVVSESTGSGVSRITSIKDPDGNLYEYSYDSHGMLDEVTYPDANAVATDNPKRIYQYNSVGQYSNYWLLRGITDERGVNFSNWNYDGYSVTESYRGQVGGDIDRVTFDYSDVDRYAQTGSVQVTNALGKVETYHYTTSHGVRRLTHIERDASTHPTDASITCPAANEYTTYDANGFIDEVTDWEGNVTDYDHDARGLEIQRIEGKGSADERTITTEWHPSLRLATRVVEPDRVIDMTYDCDTGRMETRKEYDPLSAPVYSPPAACP